MWFFEYVLFVAVLLCLSYYYEKWQASRLRKTKENTQTKEYVPQEPPRQERMEEAYFLDEENRKEEEPEREPIPRARGFEPDDAMAAVGGLAVAYAYHHNEQEEPTVNEEAEVEDFSDYSVGDMESPCWEDSYFDHDMD